MRPADLDSIMEIEREAFPNPWPAEAFMHEMRQPHSRCAVIRAGGPGSAPVAYICFWILGGEMAINNIATAPARRRSGYARRLMIHALNQAVGEGCEDAWLEVRPSNHAAIGLYRGLGFRVVSRRPAYYSDTREDALVMHTSLKGRETG